MVNKNDRINSFDPIRSVMSSSELFWKKESKRPNLYVKMFPVGRIGLLGLDRMFESRRADIHPSKFRKNDAISLQRRDEGNVLFGRNKWTAAMEKYSESLCHAVNGSENIAKAYANRSSCFLKLEFYEEALKDIDLAKEAGYPAHLMPKLDEREEKCLLGMERGSRSYERESKLCFEPDEKFPCMTNVLKIERDINGAYSVVAKEDIHVGQTVVVEENSIKYVHQRFGLRCNICLKSCMNLIPCRRCPIAMFCSVECQNHFLHRYECGMGFDKDDFVNGNTMHVVRSLFKAIQLFSSADELMSFVEQAIENDEMPASMLDGRSEYWAFLKLRMDIMPPNEFYHFALAAYCIFRAISEVPMVNAMFEAEKHCRFLMHLVFRHALIKHYNSSNFFAQRDPSKEVESVYSHFGVMSRYFSHSCYPNALKLCNDAGNSVYVIVRPVEKGQTVSISWISMLDLPNKDRHQQLRMACKCERCQGTCASQKQRQQVKESDLFRMIISSKLYLNRRSPQVAEYFAGEVYGRCVSLLEKYGHIDWCEEIQEILTLFRTMFLAKWHVLP